MPTELEEVLQHESMTLQQLLISSDASSSLNSSIMAIPKYGKSVRLPTPDLPTFQQWRSPLSSGGKSPPLLQDPTDHLQDRPACAGERSQAVG